MTSNPWLEVSEQWIPNWHRRTSVLLPCFSRHMSRKMRKEARSLVKAAHQLLPSTRIDSLEGWNAEVQGLSTEPQRKGSFEPTPFKREHSKLFMCLFVALTTPEFQQFLFCCGDRPLTITHRVGACKRSLLAHCQKSEVRMSGEPLSMQRLQFFEASVSTCTATRSLSQGTFGNILLHQRPALLHDIGGDCLMTRVPTHST